VDEFRLAVTAQRFKSGREVVLASRASAVLAGAKARHVAVAHEPLSHRSSTLVVTIGLRRTHIGM